MSAEISLNGKQYISSKRASELSGYAQDYIGQLARAGHIDAQRVAGLWYIFLESLEKYKQHADDFKPQPPVHVQADDPESLISFDGKDHISAARASKITGYHQDYVGQLARTGAILSRQVGNRWYVEREGILAHKSEKDALLAKVQIQSVGIQNPPHTPSEGLAHFDESPYLTYTSDEGDLIPNLEKETQSVSEGQDDVKEPDGEAEPEAEYSIPIRVDHRIRVPKQTPSNIRDNHVHENGRPSRKTMFYATLAASAMTIVILFSFGLTTLMSSSRYAITNTGAPSSPSIPSRNALTANASGAFGWIGDFLEKLLVPELVYRRSQ